MPELMLPNDARWKLFPAFVIFRNNCDKEVDFCSMEDFENIRDAAAVADGYTFIPWKEMTFMEVVVLIVSIYATLCLCLGIVILCIYAMRLKYTCVPFDKALKDYEDAYAAVFKGVL